ncbi:hypothetical protein [Dankookia sp. P2]|uniref:hypothetical protein n=1 Tax=Dankookia sp. P2 TaxID=3423955 RepID=UPI003D665F0D
MPPLPLLAGAASAHDGWGGGYGYGRPAYGYDQGWREREARREWMEAQRAREWAWQRHRMWEERRFEPPRGYGWGPRW